MSINSGSLQVFANEIKCRFGSFMLKVGKIFRFVGRLELLHDVVFFDVCSFALWFRTLLVLIKIIIPTDA